MTVHAYEEKIKLSLMAFEARYEDGYRYLDHCGEAIIRIRRRQRSWVLMTAARDMPQGTAMVSEKLGLVLSFGSERFNISTQGDAELASGETKAQLLGTEAEAIYEMIVDCVEAADTIRVGVRYRFTAPADSLEEADRFVSRGAKSPLLEAVLKSTRSELRDASGYFVVEDLQSGYRTRISIQSQAVVKAGDPIHTGLETSGKATVNVDLDTFTRPPTGHFQKTSFFVQKSYIRSRAVAMDLLQWHKQQR